MSEARTLRLVATRGDDVVLIAGATFLSEEKAMEAFDSAPACPGGPALLEWCGDEGDVFEDRPVSAETVEAILETTDRRPFAELLASAAPLGDDHGYRAHVRRAR